MKAPNEKLLCGDEKKDRFKKAVSRFFLYFAIASGVFILTTAAFFIVKPMYSLYVNGAIARAIGVFFVGACAIAAAILLKTKKLSPKSLILLILVAGYFLRLCYMLYTPVSVRQHDTFSYNDAGNFDYARIIFETGKLPDNNEYQLYHPPLNALIQAYFMRFVDVLTKVFEKVAGEGIFPDLYLAGIPDKADYQSVTEYGYYLFSSTQILAVLWSVVTMIMLVKTIQLFGVKGYPLAAVSAIVVFFPRHIQFAAQVNNDAISYMFQIFALFFCLKWWKNGKALVDILLCALSIGLGMMAKLSCATVALPIAAVFIFEFIRTLKKENASLPLWKMIIQYGAFLLVSAPLGLWFQFYAKAKFGQPFGFVFSNLNGELYTGDHSFFSRFFIAFDVNEWFGSLYCAPFSFHYNLFLYLIRSSLFGEFSYWQGEGFAASAFACALVAVFSLLAAVVFCLVKSFGNKKKRPEFSPEEKRNVFFVATLSLSQILCEVYFYIKMPYACTMDFRYIMPLILGIAMTAYYTRKKMQSLSDKTGNAISTISSVSIAATLCLTTLFYLSCI